MTARKQRTRLAFGEKHLESYRRLGDAFGKISNTEQFMIALSWGFKHGTRVEEFKRSDTGPRTEYLQPEHLAIIAAIHLAETGRPDALCSAEDGFDIAEQYAEGGILLLETAMDEPGDFAKMLAGEVKSEVDGLA